MGTFGALGFLVPREGVSIRAGSGVVQDGGGGDGDLALGKCFAEKLRE